MKSLSKRDVAIDWKKFGSIDINRFYDEISKNKSLVNEFGTYIAFCSTDGEFDTQLIDQNFIKLFKMSQIIIEYLLNELNRLKSTENETKSQQILIQENKKLRRLLKIHQKAMTYSGTVNGDYMQCSHCPKVFYDSTFLKTHIARRHPNESLDSEGMFSLTRKIEKYQSVLIGDNKSIEQFRTEIQALSEKLGKTELDLLLEKEARIKLEKRIEGDVEVRVQEIQQSLREQLEDFKFIQRESFFERDSHSSSENIDNMDVNNDTNEERNAKSTEVNKIEEMIAIQAKEMVKLGNNVQKLVLHLTDSSSAIRPPVDDIRPSNTGEKQNMSGNNTVSAQTRKSALNINSQNYNKKVIKEDKKFETKESEKFDENPNKNAIRGLLEIKKENSKSVSDKRKDSTTKSVRDELKEKLWESYGIDFDAKGITENEYKSALKKVRAERKLLIQQNRHDYDFVSVEKSIQKMVDQKVLEIKNPKVEDLKSFEPKVKERKVLSKVTSVTKDEESKAQTLKSNEIQSIEALVHNIPVTESSVNSNQSIMNAIDSETKQELQKSNSQVKNTQVVRPKSALVTSSLFESGTNEKSNNNEEVKAKQQRRIHFSEHRIEHQISPDESSEDTSDESYQMDFNYESAFNKNETSLQPIPAQRNNRNISSQATNPKIRDQINDDYNQRENYEIDDDLMDEILHSNPYPIASDLTESDISVKKSNQTKVQELAEMIEQQLSKRNASNKKPPIGSVNVMAADKQKLSSKTLMDRLNSDSEDEYK